MVKVSYEQKPFRKAIMQTFDANVTPSPSNTTEAGRDDSGRRIRPPAVRSAARFLRR